MVVVADQHRTLRQRPGRVIVPAAAGTDGVAHAALWNGREVRPVPAFGVRGKRRHIGETLECVHAMGRIEKRQGPFGQGMVSAGDAKKLAAARNGHGVAEGIRPGADVSLEQHVASRAVRPDCPQAVRIVKMPLLIVPAKKPDRAIVQHVRICIKILVVAQALDRLAIAADAVEVQHRGVLVPRSALAAHPAAVGGEDHIAIGQIRRLAIDEQRVIRKLPQTRAIHLHLIQVRGLGGLGVIGIGPGGEGENQAVGVVKQIHAANVALTQAAPQQRLGRRCGIKAPFDQHIAPGRHAGLMKRVVGDVVLAEVISALAEDELLERQIRAGQHQFPRCMAQLQPAQTGR